MKQEELTALGLADDVAKKVMELHQTALTEAAKDTVPRARLNEEINAKKAAETALADRDKQLEDLKKSSGDNEALKKQIEQLQNDNKAAKEKYDADILKIKMDNAVDAALGEAGAKNAKAVRGLLMEFLADAKLDTDGKVKGLAEQLAALKSAEDSSFLFNAPQNPGTPNMAGMKPGERDGGAPDPKAAGYEARLADARKNGNNLEAITIKREAFEAGINLI